MKLRVKRMGHSRNEAGVVRHYKVGDVITDATERELLAFGDRLMVVQQSTSKGKAGGKKRSEVKADGGTSNSGRSEEAG